MRGAVVNERGEKALRVGFLPGYRAGDGHIGIIVWRMIAKISEMMA
jgi:hypothetical protein